MGCHSSKLEDQNEILFDEDLAPTIISSLNLSTSPSIPPSWDKNKQSMYSSTKFLKIKSIVTMNLHHLGNFDEILEVLDLWERDVYDQLEEFNLVPSELNFQVYESTKPSVSITFQADGIRKFDFLWPFLQKVKNNAPDPEKCEGFIRENAEFLISLAPLTVYFYLQLGEEIDFGFGINKPIDRKNLSRFLQNSTDRKTITQWSYVGNVPIPILLQFSCLRPKKSCSFYIFDGDKHDNISRAFSIFDTIGAPVDEGVKKCFFSAKSEEAFCRVGIEGKEITEVAVEISQVPAEMVVRVANLLAIDVRKHFIGSAEKIALELDKKGLSLTKYSNI